MKKLFSILLAAMLIVGCIPMTALAASATISGSEHVAEAGDTVSVSFSISSIDLAGFGIEVLYDASALTLVSATNGTGLTFEPNGSWLVGYANDNKACGGNLITVTFNVTENAVPGEKYDIDLDVAELFNYDAEGGIVDIDPIVDAGLIEIKAEEKPAHEHAWGEWEVTTPADCVNPGVETRTCANADCPIGTETREIPALGHNWGEWTVTKEATCTEEGEKTRTCANANCPVGTETEKIDMIPHDMKVTFVGSCPDNHVHAGKCEVCGLEMNEEACTMVDDLDNAVVEGDKKVIPQHCDVCGHACERTETITPDEPKPEDPNLDDVPRTDDITGQVVMAGAAALVAMMAAVAFVFKRKAAK